MLNMKGLKILAAIWILCFAFPLLAQEEDPYAEYSYLWEDEEAAEKRKELDKKYRKLEKQLKRGNIPDSIQGNENIAERTQKLLDKYNLDHLPPQPVVASDTLPDTPADTLQPEEQIPPRDTVPDPEPEVIPEDTAKKQADEPVTEVAEEETESKKEKKKKKKERKEPTGPPVEDFRAGLGNLNQGSSINGGFTYTQIGDEQFVGMTISPELSIWKIGVGLNIPILFSLEDYSFRDEIYKDGVGAARLISYIRYGVQKKDPVYVKVGQLTNTMIGYGGLVNNYTNSTSFEKRKVGIHYDLNFKGLFGVEGMYSDFDPGTLNLLAVRPYVRPLSFTGIPIVRTLEIGSTIVRDNDQTDIPISDSTSTSYQFTQNTIGAFGLDAGITLLRVPFIQIDAFITYSSLDIGPGGLADAVEDSLANPTFTAPETLEDGEFSNGTGFSYGMNFRFHFIADLLSTDVRIERLNYSEHYIPQFFDANYELNKDARIYSLVSAPEASGIYGSLTGHILKKVQLGGSLLIPDNISAESPAVVRVNADVDRLADKISVHGSYIKGNLTDLGEAFTLDERSIAQVRFIYHLNRFLAAGVDYYWAFTPVGDGSYEATKYVSPYFGLSISF